MVRGGARGGGGSTTREVSVAYSRVGITVLYLKSEYAFYKCMLRTLTGLT